MLRSFHVTEERRCHDGTFPRAVETAHVPEERQTGTLITWLRRRNATQERARVMNTLQ